MLAAPGRRTTPWTGAWPMTNGETPDSLGAEKLGNGKWVWLWTSPGGACHQGAKHYQRKADALRAGQEWLAAQRPLIGPSG